ncbi:hypothetical protein ScPMuIL_009336 [Solemya velum]
MLGGSFFGGAEEDPFFTKPLQMGMPQPMFAHPFGFPGVVPHPQQMLQVQASPTQQRAIAPFPMFENDMSHFGFDSMFSNMRNMMADMHRTFRPQGNNAIMNMNNPDGHSFTQSSVMTYSNTGQGPPKVYQATASTRTAPGGVREVKKAERDSESGLHKMAVGHHIHDRAHVIERSHNVRTGDQSENQDFINLDEEEAEQFNREWEDSTKQYTRSLEYRRPDRRNRHPRRHGRSEQLALQDSEQVERRHRDDRPYDEGRRDRNSHHAHREKH